jgi:DNA-binding response OmpR family regulator
LQSGGFYGKLLMIHRRCGSCGRSPAEKSGAAKRIKTHFAAPSGKTRRALPAFSDTICSFYMEGPPQNAEFRRKSAGSGGCRTEVPIMARILIADDEKMLRTGLREYAEFEGHTVAEARNGPEAVRLCRAQDFDLLILDVMMPGLDGFEVCREVRRFKDIPVLMLSARGEEYDKLEGFRAGIDDYVVKPFSPKEVMARVKVIVERHRAQTEKPQMLPPVRFGGLLVDMPAGRVLIDGVKTELTPKEAELLFYLVRNRGVPKTREEILRDVWGMEPLGEDRTVDTHVKMLRGSLKLYKDCIVTVRGVGYKFEPPAAEESGA